MDCSHARKKEPWEATDGTTSCTSCHKYWGRKCSEGGGNCCWCVIRLGVGLWLTGAIYLLREVSAIQPETAEKYLGYLAEAVRREWAC